MCRKNVNLVRLLEIDKLRREKPNNISVDNKPCFMIALVIVQVIGF